MHSAARKTVRPEKMEMRTTGVKRAGNLRNSGAECSKAESNEILVKNRQKNKEITFQEGDVKVRREWKGIRAKLYQHAALKGKGQGGEREKRWKTVLPGACAN